MRRINNKSEGEEEEEAGNGRVRDKEIRERESERASYGDGYEARLCATTARARAPDYGDSDSEGREGETHGDG